MSFELKLAWRYFRAGRKSLARFTSIVAVTGIAAGVASLIVAQALARGFSGEMQDKILANTAHVSVFSSDETPISNWREAKNNLEKLENVEKVSATTYESTLISGENATNYAILRVEDFNGINTDDNESEEKRLIVKNEQLVTRVAIGAKLAEKNNLKPDDEAEIITLENETEPRRSRVLVAEIFQTGLYEYDSTWIRISPADFAALHGQPNFAPTILSVSVKDIYKADKIAAAIRVNLGENFKVVSWQEANQPLFAALSLERKAAFAVISLIIFIAALNITTTLALLVNERKFDIAILRTCGAKTTNLIFVFLYEGLFLGFLGILFGVVLGLLACFAGNYFKIISLSAEVYSLNYIPFRPDLTNVLLIVCAAFVLCLAATIYPALKASRLKPSENLRTQ